MLRGNCAAVARLAALFFDKGMVSNQMTGFPIPESRQRFRSTEHLKLLTKCGYYKALDERSETGSETEQVGSGMNGRRRS
jgi:hypothetical protein